MSLTDRALQNLQNFQRKVLSSKILAGLGGLTAAYYVLRLVGFAKLHGWHRSKLPHYLKGSEGDTWALVTGSSDGIGKALAYELAEKGFNIVLHGRNEEKLSGVKDELGRFYPSRRFEMLVIDASESQADVGKAVTLIEKLPGKLRLLVNNCGGIAKLDNPFSAMDEQTPEGIDATINLSAVFNTQITRALLPVLTRNTPSLIVNCGSGAGIWPCPFISVYAGTKGYINSWGNALTREMKAKKLDIEVLTITIGQVNETQGMPGRPTFFAPSARTEAKSILAKIGCGEETVVAHWTHALQIGLVGQLPRSSIASFMTRSGLQLREAHLKKSLVP